jgi:hypothetical protein
VLHILIVCSLCLSNIQSAFTVLYCRLWPEGLCSIFLHFLTNGKISEKKLLNIKCVLWYSLQPLSVGFLILIIIQRDIINVHMSSCNVPVIRVRF